VTRLDPAAAAQRWLTDARAGHHYRPAPWKRGITARTEVPHDIDTDQVDLFAVLAEINAEVTP
jgi:hypothetical protein